MGLGWRGGPLGWIENIMLILSPAVYGLIFYLVYKIYALARRTAHRIMKKRNINRDRE